MTSPAEDKTSCSSYRLDHLYPACIKYTCSNIWVARALSSISLTIQPPDHTDSSDQSVIDSIHGSPDSFMLNFVDPDTGAMCLRPVETQHFDGDVDQGNYHLEDPLVTAVAYGNNMQILVRRSYLVSSKCRGGLALLLASHRISSRAQAAPQSVAMCTTALCRSCDFRRRIGVA